MRVFLILLLMLCASTIAIGQDIDSVYQQEVSPKQGLNALAVEFLGIEFSEEQRFTLRNVEVQLFFLVDENGKPVLSEINGINDISIRDSLYAKSEELEHFIPVLEMVLLKNLFTY